MSGIGLVIKNVTAVSFLYAKRSCNMKVPSFFPRTRDISWICRDLAIQPRSLISTACLCVAIASTAVEAVASCLKSYNICCCLKAWFRFSGLATLLIIQCALLCHSLHLHQNLQVLYTNNDSAMVRLLETREYGKRNIINRLIFALSVVFTAVIFIVVCVEL